MKSSIKSNQHQSLISFEIRPLTSVVLAQDQIEDENDE